VTNITLSGIETNTFAVDYTTSGAHPDIALGTSSSVRYAGVLAATFYGIASGAPGQVLRLHNASTNTLTLSNLSPSELTAANKIITGTGSDMVMQGNSSAMLQYDGTAGDWQVIGGSGGGIPAGSSGQLQYNSGSNSFAASSNLTFNSTSNALAVGTGASAPVGLGTTGNVATVVMSIIPQAVAVTPASVTGGIAVNNATTGQVAYYSGPTTISGTSNVPVADLNGGSGASSSTYWRGDGTWGKISPSTG
jgi:hypothetical protein